MKKLLWLVVLVLVVWGVYSLLNSPEAVAPEQNVSENTDVNQETGGEMEGIVADEGVVITYSDTGYSPNSVTVKVGDTVTFKNESSKNMWPASAMHPTHVVYSGTSLSEHCPDTANTAFDACKGYAPGTQWSFTFTKAGEWKFHDHLTATNFGTIVVQ